MQLAPRTLLRGAAAVAAAFGVLLLLAYLAPGARWVDAAGLHGFMGLQTSITDGITGRLAGLGDPLEVVIFGSVLVLLALARGRPRVALFIVALIGLTSISSQVLKEVLAYPRYSWGEDAIFIKEGAFPSGHATAAMAVAISLVVALPARLRPAAAVAGTGLVLAISYSMVTRGWHFPSDVAGGYMLATGWALVLLAALQAAGQRWPERHWRSMLERPAENLAAAGLGASLLAGAAILLAAVAVVVTYRLPDLAAYVQDHTSFFAVAIALFAAAIAPLIAFAIALRRRA